MASWCTGVLWSDYREHLCAFQGGCEEARERGREDIRFCCCAGRYSGQRSMAGRVQSIRMAFAPPTKFGECFIVADEFTTIRRVDAFLNRGDLPFLKGEKFFDCLGGKKGFRAVGGVREIFQALGHGLGEANGDESLFLHKRTSFNNHHLF